MKKVLGNVLPIFAGIVITGLLLDEAGKGTFGNTIKSFAGKVTRGYGV